MSKKTWIYIPDIDRCALVESFEQMQGSEFPDPAAVQVFAAKVKAPTELVDVYAKNYTPHAAVMENKYQNLPVIETLNIALQVVILIDKIMPFFVRWWKMLFGSENEKAQAHLHERAAKAYRRAKTIIEIEES
jgi:hypothetical protein